MNFKSKFTLGERKTESTNILKKYPSRVPIICERSRETDIPLIDKHKYLVPRELSLGQFIYVIRRRLKLDAVKAIFLFINNTIPPSMDIMGTLYENHKDIDGFLYITYSGENTFG